MESEFSLLSANHACFWYAFLLMLVSVTSSLIIKSLNKHNTEKHAKPKLPLPPGPKPWPIVGNLPEMLANRPAFRWIHKLMSDMDTDIACIRLGNYCFSFFHCLLQLLSFWLGEYHSNYTFGSCLVQNLRDCFVQQRRGEEK